MTQKPYTGVVAVVEAAVVLPVSAVVVVWVVSAVVVVAAVSVEDEPAEVLAAEPLDVKQSASRQKGKAWIWFRGAAVRTSSTVDGDDAGLEDLASRDTYVEDKLRVCGCVRDGSRAGGKSTDWQAQRQHR